MISPTIGLILRSLAGAVVMPELFGEKAARLQPVLDTLASLAELPAKLEPERQALLAKVQSWVDEKRPPTDAELDEFKAQRDALDRRAREARAALDREVP